MQNKKSLDKGNTSQINLESFWLNQLKLQHGF